MSRAPEPEREAVPVRGEAGRASLSSRPAAPPRQSPPPLEANDQLVATVITVGWAIALVVLLAVRSDLRPGERWWIWVAVAGVGQGLFGLVYLPYLKRSRQHAARRAKPATDRTGRGK